MGIEHDGLPLGSGKVNWDLVKPFTIDKDFIFEITNPDQNDCTPMVESAKFYNKIK